VIGSSLGAEVGLSLTANHPDAVNSLVCEGALFNEFGTYGIWEGTEEEFKEYAKKTLEEIRDRPKKTYSTLDDLVSAKRANYDQRGWWNSHFEAVVRYGAVALESGGFTECWEFIREAYMRHYLFYQFDQYYEKIHCPVLLLPDSVPGQDEREKEIMEGFNQLLKRGRIEYIPEWVHPYGWLITPERASLTIYHFLKTNGANSPDGARYKALGR
jgi:2-succinyl-6-hydroxy-2,4-cyclohexadiene-1-carboxylate synthase